MSRLKALREKLKERGQALCAVRDKMNAEGYSPTGEDQTNWEAVNKDYNETHAAITREERAEEVDKYLNSVDPSKRPGGSGGPDDRARGGSDGASLANDARTRELAFSSWCRAQFDQDLTEEQEHACKAMGMSPYKKSLSFNLLSSEQHAGLQSAMSATHPQFAREHGTKFLAALSNTSGTTGGFLIPPASLLSSLEINMLAFGGLLQAAETMTTTSGEPLMWPTMNDTNNKGRRLGANAAAMNQKDPTFSNVIWYAYKYTSDAVLIPYELLEDSNANLVPILGPMLGERLGRIFNDECTTGTGASMPKGIVTAAAAGVTSAKAGLIQSDDLIKLEHSVDPAYRTGASYMMHDKILLQVRLLKDGIGQYLYKSGAQFAAPDTLNGRSIDINQSMTQSSTVTGDIPILFGQMNKYKVRRVNGIRVYRLEERFRDNDQDGFVALIRGDGNLLDAGTTPVKRLTIQ